MWKNIISRFKIPRVFAFDNGKQFDNDTFRDFCKQLGIKKPLLFTCPLIGQWTGWGYKSNFAQNNQDSAWGGKGDIARRATKRSMGIRDDDLNTYRWDTLLPCIQEWSNHSNRSGLTSNRVAHHEGKNKEGIHLQLDLYEEVRATAK